MGYNIEHDTPPTPTINPVRQKMTLYSIVLSILPAVIEKSPNLDHVAEDAVAIGVEAINLIKRQKL